MTSSTDVPFRAVAKSFSVVTDISSPAKALPTVELTTPAFLARTEAFQPRSAAMCFKTSPLMRTLIAFPRQSIPFATSALVSLGESERHRHTSLAMMHLAGAGVKVRCCLDIPYGIWVYPSDLCHFPIRYPVTTVADGEVTYLPVSQCGEYASELLPGVVCGYGFPHQRAENFDC
jgi:hypothetical protein